MVKHKLHNEVCWLIGGLAAFVLNLIFFIIADAKVWSIAGMTAAALGVLGSSISIKNMRKDTT